MKSPFSTAVVAASFGFLAVNAFEYPDCVDGPLANNTVCDPKASPADRAAALVKAMNITEKLVNLVDESKGAPRLGLPPYAWWSEALHGVAYSPGVNFARTGDSFRYATSFPNPILMSAAFDDDLILKVASVISTEARAFSNAGHAGLDFWTPDINPYKDPRWGRGAETPGEDTFRIKGYVKALLAGLEGNEKTRKMIATCKHYAAYDLEEWNGVERHNFNAVVSSQDLSEYYLPPFQQCARDSNVGSIMCSYNALNGTPACADSYLMKDILREHWGWKEDNNYITSDCNAIQDFLPEYHNFSQTAAEAAAVAYEAGTDTVCEVQGYPPYTDVVGAFNQTLLSEETIDVALQRLYHGLIKAGYFDPPSEDPYREISWADVNTEETQALALQAAVDGIVLLKNDGILPITFGNRSVALIGHWANATGQMIGGYSGIPPYFHNPVYAAEQLDLTYVYAPGPVNQNSSVNDTWTTAALDAAEKSDVVLYFGGNDLSIEAEDGDRDSIAWPEAQLTLLGKLSALGKPLVVVQLGNQNDDTPLLEDKNVSAIVWAGFPGQSGGTAVFNILTGKDAPAGRLPVTQYKADYTDAVPMTEMALRPIEGSSPGRTYRWFNDPALVFGYGLHYTDFEVAYKQGNASAPGNGSTYAIADLVAACDEKQHLDLCPIGDAPLVSVHNAGETITSDFVALSFLAGDFGPEPRPIKTLVGYGRARGVAPGKTAEVALQPLTLGSLARVDTSGNTVLYPGSYMLMLDHSDLSEVHFKLTGDEVVLDKFPQPKGASS